jgi:hypothetical protein
MDGLRYPGRFRPAYLPGLQIEVQFYIPDFFGETGSFYNIYKAGLFEY